MRELRGDETERRLIAYFKKSLQNKNPRYFKAKHLAQDLNDDLGKLTAKMVGNCLEKMSGKNLGTIRVINYAYALSTTWKVELVKS